MPHGHSLVLTGSAIGGLILTGVLTFLSSLMNITPPVARAQAIPIDPGIASHAPVPQEIENYASIESCQVNAQFPFEVHRWCNLVTHYATQNNLPPNLVAALIWQESGGDPDAYSRSGAVGLMQIMPRDGIAAQFQCINGPCFSDRPTMAELFDPEFNIRFGTRMLNQLIHRHGDLREALRAYGPMDVGYTYADKVLSIYQKYSQE